MYPLILSNYFSDYIFQHDGVQKGVVCRFELNDTARNESRNMNTALRTVSITPVQKCLYGTQKSGRKLTVRPHEEQR